MGGAASDVSEETRFEAGGCGFSVVLLALHRFGVAAAAQARLRAARYRCSPGLADNRLDAQQASTQPALDSPRAGMR